MLCILLNALHKPQSLSQDIAQVLLILKGMWSASPNKDGIPPPVRRVTYHVQVIQLNGDFIRIPVCDILQDSHVFQFRLFVDTARLISPPAVGDVVNEIVLIACVVFVDV